MTDNNVQSTTSSISIATSGDGPVYYAPNTTNAQPMIQGDVPYTITSWPYPLPSSTLSQWPLPPMPPAATQDFDIIQKAIQDAAINARRYEVLKRLINGMTEQDQIKFILLNPDMLELIDNPSKAVRNAIHFKEL